MELPGVWRGLGYTKAGWRGRRCSGPTCQQRLSGGEALRRSVMLSGNRFGASLLSDLCVGAISVLVVSHKSTLNKHHHS
uniref:Uncharacterized protein n=1 Tax=Oryza meridionalis TaxID=40149 RepID=A0A0E0CI97_9ORYZ